MSSKLRTVFLNEPDFGRWNKFVAESSTGSIYSCTDYLRLLCEVTSGSFRVLAVLKGEEIQGGVALFERTAWHGTYVSSRLLLYYNSILLRDFSSRYPSEVTSKQIATEQALVTALQEINYSRLLFHCRQPTDLRPFLSSGWRIYPTYSYVAAIDDLEVTWSKIEQNQRRLIRRCEERGVILTEDDDFDSFYEQHQETHRRKGSPLYLPREQYCAFISKLQQKKLATLYHARLPDGKSIACQLVLLGEHPVSHTVCAGADAEYLKIGSTPFLRWKAWESLSAKGYKGNDLTDATLNPVTRFKSQLGGKLTCNMVLQRKDSSLFQLDQRLKRWSALARGVAGRVLRPIRKNDGS